MSNNLSDYQFVFNIKSPHWDEEPNTWKKARPVGLDTIVDFGMSTELEFDDGGSLEIKDIDWEVDEVVAGLWKDEA